jgi:CubicO group peptidase (beta-lactamase class C family)
LLDKEVQSGFIPGLATAVYQQGKLLSIAFAGCRKPDDPSFPVAQDTIFLVASLTKPIVCAGALLLLQEGCLTLDQQVTDYVADFRGKGKEGIVIRHLLTHTSGLPDQLPQNPELRKNQAPLVDFVHAVCNADLLFTPGTHVRYQSMGILMLGEIVERITGMRLRDYLREKLFIPLGMLDTALGLPESGMKRVAYSLPSAFDPGSADYGDDWNTLYWRDLCAPWGGLHSTTEDLGRFLMHIMGQKDGPLSPAVRNAMTRDQIMFMPDIPADEKLANRWGLGFKLGAKQFGDLVSKETYGHLGATGSMYWVDPTLGLAFVLLSNQPQLLTDLQKRFVFSRVSNVIVSAIKEHYCFQDR